MGTWTRQAQHTRQYEQHVQNLREMKQQSHKAQTEQMGTEGLVSERGVEVNFPEHQVPYCLWSLKVWSFET